MDGDAYGTLSRRFARIGALDEAAAVLGWDQSAMMPAGGAAARGEQLAALAGLAHEMLVSPRTAEGLAGAQAEVAAGGDDWRGRNLALMRHAFERASALPAELVEARARAETSCEMVWREARAQDDFARVTEPLERLLGIVREEARLLGQALGLTPYDALVDLYQPGIGQADIDPIFDRYEAFLRSALPEAEALQARSPVPIALPPVPDDVQERVCRRLAEGAGLDWRHARLDRSLHPFCGGTPDDVRITTRYSRAEPGGALMGVLHETGHALYQRGLPAEWRRQPVGESAGMAVHESQSLILEMQACRSDAYLDWLSPVLAAEYGDAAACASANLRRLWRRVERSLIRVDADELTYPAHVILRFRLERAMIGGSLAVRDLPGAWSDGLQALLGIRPADDRSGCLQDIHWYSGVFGYFPCYSLGAMAAAQLMRAARGDLSDLDARLGEGDLSTLVGWLRRTIHSQGRRLGMNALIERATGRPLEPGAFEDHLRCRYLAAS